MLQSRKPPPLKTGSPTSPPRTQLSFSSSSGPSGPSWPCHAVGPIPGPKESRAAPWPRAGHRPSAAPERRASPPEPRAPLARAVFLPCVTSNQHGTTLTAARKADNIFFQGTKIWFYSGKTLALLERKALTKIWKSISKMLEGHMAFSIFQPSWRPLRGLRLRGGFLTMRRSLQHRAVERRDGWHTPWSIPTARQITFLFLT